MSRRTWLADLGLFYCALVWGSMFFLVKNALSGVHPAAMAAGELSKISLKKGKRQEVLPV